MDKLWWNQVPNALRFVDSVMDKLQDGKNVVLALPQYVPWYWSFKERIDFLKAKLLSSYVIKDITDDDSKEPGEITLNSFCKKELRDDFRPAIGYGKFLAETNNTLNNHIAWIKVMSAERANKWSEFISDYSKQKKIFGCGLFVVEVMESEKLNSPKGVAIVSFGEYISGFDYYIFNILGSSVLSMSKDMKEYFAEVLTAVIGNDVELAAQCLSNGVHKDFLENPAETIKAIIGQESRSNGEYFVFQKDQSQIEMDVWKAQIKNLFPKIESYREEFAKKYSSEIEKNLPISASYGEEYKMPEEVELGTLYYLAKNKMLTISTEDFSKLKCFKNARNKLAHLNSLSIDEVNDLLAYM